MTALLLPFGQKPVAILGLASAELTELARAVCRAGVQHDLEIQYSSLILYRQSVSLLSLALNAMMIDSNPHRVKKITSLSSSAKTVPEPGF